MHADASASLYPESLADAKATLRYVAGTRKSLCFCVPTPPMVRLDTDPLQLPVDMDSISGGSENVCIRTSLICGGRHQS